MSDFEGEYGWFSQLTEKLWKEIVLPRFANVQGPLWYVETGCAEGASLCWALEHLGREGGLFLSIDQYLDARHWHKGEGASLKARALKNIAAWYGLEAPDPATITGLFAVSIDGKPHCELHIKSSEAYFLGDFRKYGGFHVAYVDGGHNAPDALLDIIMLFKMLREDGVLIVDDVDRKVRGGRPQVWPAILAFEATHEGYFDRLYIHQKQVAYVKRPRRRHGYPPVMVQGPVIVPK